jgi:ABC-2 type transport system permease protein
LNEAVVHRGFGLARHSLWQTLRTFYDMSKKTIVEFSRYPVAFVALFAQIFLIIAIFMLAAFTFSTPETAQGPAAQRLAGVVLYGFVVNMFLSFTLWEIGFSVREEQVRGTLESLYLSPANQFGTLVARVFAILLWTSLMSVFALLLVATIVGGLPADNAGLALAVLLLSVSGFLGIGLAFAGITIKLKETAQFLVGFLQFFFMIFSAVFFPFSALPQPLIDYVSRWLPVSYSVDAFRSILLNAEGYPELLPLEVELVIVSLFGILGPIVGYAVYKVVERSSRRAGTLGEY